MPRAVPPSAAWSLLVERSFALARTASHVSGDEARRQALVYLDTVLEAFPADLDPVDGYEAWAVRRMALALREALSTKR